MTEPLQSRGAPRSEAAATTAAPAQHVEEIPDQTAAPAGPRHLRVVEPRSRRRMLGGRTVFLVAAGVALAVAFGLVYLHVVMAQRQFQLDSLNTKVSQEQNQYQALRLQVAELDSPQQIISTAEGKLGMRQPASVVYLSPQSAGGSSAANASSGAPTSTRAGRNDVVTAPSGDADWPRIKADLAGSP